MDIKLQIQTLISEALNSEFKIIKKPQDIHLERPQDEDHGDWSTNIAMTLAKELKQNPRDIADKLVTKLKALRLKPKIDIHLAGPGFINFSIDDKFYKSELIHIDTLKDKFGNNERLKGKKIMIEFAHPNPFKSFHIGHLRNIILGESLVRLLESQGADVIRTNYQGDVGMHIAKCLWSFKNIDPKDYPATADEKTALLGKCYAEGALAFEENETSKEEIKKINQLIYSRENEEITKLWELGKKWSLEKFHEIYKRVYSYFEREYMESETLLTCMKHIENAKNKGILKESEGALIFDGEKYGLDTRVFLNAQNLPTYEGKELGLAYMEFSDYGKIDLCIHNVAVEQISFFKVTFKVEELLDPVLFKDKQYHNAYEFVGLKKGKMSSRKGNVVLGNDILNEAHKIISEIVKEKGIAEDVENASEIIGIGAIKYSFLKISPFKYLAFDLEESVNFEGDSGPYIQYTYARAKSILKDFKSLNTKFDMNDVLNSDEEITLLKWLTRFPDVVEKASIEYSPNYICTYLFELSQKFNSFYRKHSVTKAETENIKNARLLLTKTVSQIIQKGLDLLGIKTLEKM